MTQSMYFGDGAASARIRVRPKAARAQQAGFDGMAQRRRLSGWFPSTASINTLLAQGGELLRSRCRDVTRNNPYAIGAAECFESNLVGTGIKPASMAQDKALRKQLNDTWLAWTDECDADGMADFYGLQSIGARALFEAGEFFIRFRPRRADDMSTVPLQLQMLESDMLPFSDNRTLGLNTVINGVEFNQVGQRVAYHFYSSHPGETIKSVRSMTRPDQVRVPARDVIHVFRVNRPGQVRGYPIIAGGLVKMWMLDQYDDAELDRKKTAAMFAGFIRSPAPTDLVADISDTLDTEHPIQSTREQEGIVTLEPGTMQVLLPGEEIDFSQPVEVGGSYEAFEYRNLLGVFAAVGVPYALGTGDMRQANYSSMRGAIVEFRRRISKLQHNTLVFQMCRPIRQRWLVDGVLSGRLDVPRLAREPAQGQAKWIPPKFDWVDPLKDITAEVMAIRSGLKSLKDSIEETGEEPEQVFDRIAEGNTELDDRDIILDSDPRNTAKSGIEQKAEQLLREDNRDPGAPPAVTPEPATPPRAARPKEEAA